MERYDYSYALQYFVSSRKRLSEIIASTFYVALPFSISSTIKSLVIIPDKKLQVFRSKLIETTASPIPIKK